MSNRVIYEELGDEFSPREIQLIMQHNRIFNNSDADPCPICSREKAPMTTMAGPCLKCIEDALRNSKGILVKHLPDIWPADADLIKMAHELIARDHETAEGAAIAYIMKAKHMELNGKIRLGSCSKQSAKAKLLHGWDFIIEIAWDMWAMMNDLQREALLLHEICHINRTDDGFKLASHSVEEHTKVIQKYGLWMPDLEAFAAAIKAVEVAGEERQRPLFDSETGDGEQNAGTN